MAQGSNCVLELLNRFRGSERWDRGDWLQNVTVASEHFHVL